MCALEFKIFVGRRPASRVITPHSLPHQPPSARERGGQCRFCGCAPIRPWARRTYLINRPEVDTRFGRGPEERVGYDVARGRSRALDFVKDESGAEMLSLTLPALVQCLVSLRTEGFIGNSPDEWRMRAAGGASADTFSGASRSLARRCLDLEPCAEFRHSSVLRRYHNLHDKTKHGSFKEFLLQSTDGT